jgi:phosphoribosyl-ATP pyrophosphohydrolase/phosphoribosyl-AMP cyclohydrolase
MKIDFKKGDGLVPAIVQDVNTGAVLMLGYMNEESIRITNETQKVTFYSRSKQRIWTKGEVSGNVLNFVEMHVDCDNDTLLIQAIPTGPVCHKGTDTCFPFSSSKGFVYKLDKQIQDYKQSPSEDSYTSSLFESGLDRVVQKVGEEAIELVIAAKNNENERVVSEGADLIYHMLVLLAEKGLSWSDIETELSERSKS